MVQPSRRRGRGRTRILYWFRTPPGVRVGRGPLDEEAIRIIEASNPDLEFDWTRILKGQAADGPAVERRESRGGRDRRPGGPDTQRRAEGEPKAPPVTVPPITAQPAEPMVPAVEEPTTAAHARLGSEGLARLRGRYSETLARIAERIPDAERQEELKTLAERLNPDAWVTDGDVTEGLESYETTFASLRAALGAARKIERPEPDGNT